MAAPSNPHLQLKSYRRRIREIVSREPRVAVYFAMLIVAIVVLAGWIFSRATKFDDIANISTAEPPPPVKDEVTERQRRIQFFESQVVANLQVTDEANRLAAERCVRQIEQNFQRYREGVDGFVDELTGIKSRFGILRRMPGGWWSGDDRVGQYITEKFESHLFSEATLTDDLKGALETFRDDIRANQRELLIKTQAAVEQSDLPPIKLDDYEVFFAIVNKQIGDLANAEAKTSVTDGVVTLVVSEAGSTAIGMIAGRLIASLGASTAATVATSGGATVGGAATGAAGGSIVPGAGTIVGFGVGLVVGFGIDYWMNNQTAAKLRGELLQYINSMESDLLLGPESAESRVDDQGSPAPKGIQASVNSACDRLRDGVHQTLFDIIVLEQPQ